MKNYNNHIRYLTRKEIDVKKWDETIGGSHEFRIYATARWLDIVSPEWSALVLNDYLTVMPLPVKNKYGIKYLAQPPLTQQLGIYGKTNGSIINEFYKAIKKFFKYIEMNVNHFANEHSLFVKKNYVISLNRTYSEIISHYNKNTSRNIRKAQYLELKYSQSNRLIEKIEMLEKFHSSNFHVNNTFYKKMQILMSYYYCKGQCFIKEIKTKQNEVVSSGFFIKDRSRIYEIASATTKKGRDMKAHHFMIDCIINEYSGQEILLDFEGSNIPGIEKFNLSFGAVCEPYYFLKWNNLPFPINLLKK